MKLLSYLTIMLILIVFPILSNAQTNNWNLIQFSGDTLFNCHLFQADDSLLNIEYNGQLRSIAIDSITSLIRSKESHFSTGAIMGLVSGTLIGAAIGAGSSPNSEHNFIDQQGLSAFVGGLIGGLAGVLVGGIAGASTGTDEEEYLPSNSTHTQKVMIIRKILPY